MSPAIEMKAMFSPAVEFGKTPVDKWGIAVNCRKGDTLKKFLESWPAALAFIRALYSYLGGNTMGGVERGNRQLRKERGEARRIARPPDR